MIARETASRTATVVVTVQARAAGSHGMKHGPWCDSWTAARSDGADPVATGPMKRRQVAMGAEAGAGTGDDQASAMAFGQLGCKGKKPML